MTSAYNANDAQFVMEHCTVCLRQISYCQRRRQTRASRLSPSKMSLSPQRETYWSRIRCELCEISTFWSFLQSKSVNNVCKLLQLQT